MHMCVFRACHISVLNECLEDDPSLLGEPLLSTNIEERVKLLAES